MTSQAVAACNRKKQKSGMRVLKVVWMTAQRVTL